MLDMADITLFEDEIARIYSEMETELIAYIVRQIQRGGYADPESWAVRKLDGMMGLRRQIRAKISSLMQEGYEELEKEVERIVRLSADEDTAYFRDIARKAGESALSSTVTAVSESAIEARVRAIMLNCRSALNLTNTGALEASMSLYRDAVNKAYVSVLEGTSSLDAAVKRACREIGSTGITLTYPSSTGGKATVISLDAGIRRSVVTSVNQAVSSYTLEQALEYGCDLVQTTAHAGARPEHEVWQGKVFSLSGKSSKYGNFYAETGYGSVTGLCGINCKHSFYPFFEGMTPTDWHIDLTPRENEELYDDIQRQRGYERTIRAWKRRQAVAKEIGDTADYANATSHLKATQQKLRDFIKEAGLTRRLSREQI